MDIELSCDVCGSRYCTADVTPVVNEGIMRTWSDLHNHTPEELTIFHDHAVEAEKHRWEHPLEGHDHG